jgi:chromosomal replication initiator protein
MLPSVEKIDVWNNVLLSVEKRLNKQIVDTWFRRIQFEDYDEKENVLRLRAAQVTKEWVSTYYSELIRQSLKDMNIPDSRLDWQIEETELGQEFYADDEIDVDFSAQRKTTYAGAQRTAAAAVSQIESAPEENSLNARYTFGKFVVGSCNQFAHAAAESAADSPGKTYNPLFIYGGVGMGKTHLMHAIGHEIKQRNRHMRVAYITSEKFMNELINAIRYDKTQTFREKYRSIDVLLMDDVQFLAGKERTQEEFFHTFNALHNDQKQIVITSDCPPREIPTLEERLHSRFEWGLIADIEPPDLETKVAILKRKAEMDRVSLPDDVAMFIAGKVRSNIRELEGSLVRLRAISSLRGHDITISLARDALKNIIDAEHPAGLTMERIARVVASHYKLTVEELKSKSNTRGIAVPRQVAMYLSKRLTKHSYPEVGREFGGKHHTTVMHAYEKIDQLTRDDRVFHNSVNELIDNLCS